MNALPTLQKFGLPTEATVKRALLKEITARIKLGISKVFYITSFSSTTPNTDTSTLTPPNCSERLQSPSYSKHVAN